jgi:hypothetical protein
MTSLDIIQGTIYSCENDSKILNFKKSALDFALKSPNYDTAKLKQLQNDYDFSKSKYDASGCGKNSDRDKCLDYQSQIANLRSTISYSLVTRDVKHAKTNQLRLEEITKKYKDLNCDAKISEFRGDVVMSIADVYQQIDKERIEAESKYRFKQRLFFGGIVFFGALLMVTMFDKKN